MRSARADNYSPSPQVALFTGRSVRISYHMHSILTICSSVSGLSASKEDVLQTCRTVQPMSLHVCRQSACDRSALPHQTEKHRQPAVYSFRPRAGQIRSITAWSQDTQCSASSPPQRIGIVLPFNATSLRLCCQNYCPCQAEHLGNAMLLKRPFHEYPAGCMSYRTST